MNSSSFQLVDYKMFHENFHRGPHNSQIKKMLKRDDPRWFNF
jgi:hypothetical protein